MRIRKPDIDTFAEVSRIINAAGRVVRLPDDVVLTKVEKAAFDEILDEVPAHTLSPANVRIAVALARAMLSLADAQSTRNAASTVRSRTTVVISLRRALGLVSTGRDAARRERALELERKAGGRRKPGPKPKNYVPSLLAGVDD